VLEAVGATLRERNHSVQTVSTLSEAKSVLERQDFDVVVADLQVLGNARRPGLQAWLAVNRPALVQSLVLMRASPPSGPGSDESLDGFPMLQKPFKAADLLATVEAALGDIHAATIER
jgi:DNA-binding response OmpR family regulator